MENVTLLDVYKKILEISYKHNMSHIGSSLSVAPILYKIYKNKKEDEIVILSKGHAAAAMYAILLLVGKITEEELDKNFCGHITTKIPGIYWSTGSLGHGLPIAIGCIHANPSRKVHVVLSDGELDEGSTLEAIYFILNNKTWDNLKVYVDRNGYSATKKTNNYILYYMLEDNWENFSVIENNKGLICLKELSGLKSHYKKISKEDYERYLLGIDDWLNEE